MKHRRWPAAPAIAAVVVLGACGSAEQEPSAPATSTSPTSDAATASAQEAPDIVDDMASTSGPGSAFPGLPSGGVTEEIASRPAVQAAIQDLADRRSVPVENVAVVGYAEVTWSDGSLGCPQPGMVYSQALVDGQQLILRVEGAEQDLASYHAGRGGTFRYCENPQPPTSSGGTDSR